MKKVFLLIIIMLCIKTPSLNAECKELKDFVNKEEFVSLSEINEEEPYIFLEIYNIFIPSVYVVIEENFNNTKISYNSSNIVDNYLSIKYINIDKITNYKIKIYGNIDTCQDELLRTIEVNTTKKNQYYDSQICEKHREYEKCSLFADTGNITLEELEKEINKLAEKNKKENNFFKNINFQLFLYIFTPMILIGGFFTIKIIILKRRRRT